MDRCPRVAINGFGRIGRAICRQIMANHQLELVAINDIAGPETCAYLYNYDSVYGVAQHGVTVTETGLDFEGRAVRMTNALDLAQVDLHDVDLVLECTGKANTDAFAQAGMRAGAKAVLISGPSPVADVTIVQGANDAALTDQRVVSNASCTTNALAPLLAALDSEYGFTSGHMTTIHCYTGSQPTVDAPRGGALERNRAAALSMVPTTTSAMRLIDQVLPQMKGRIKGCAVRVPTASVSAIDLTCQLQSAVTAADLNAFLSSARPGVIGAIDAPLVSSDLRGRPESLVLARPETTQISDTMLRVFGWYDNEWGFAARMIDVAQTMAQKL